MEMLIGLFVFALSVFFMVLFVLLCLDVKALRRAAEDSLALQRAAFQKAQKASRQGTQKGEFWGK